MKIIGITLSSILFLLYLYLAFLLNDLGLLSNKILLSIFVFVGVIILLVIFGMLKTKKNVLKISFFVISLLIMIACSVGIYYSNSTINFIDNIGNSKENYDYYYVIVMKDSKYTKLNDLNGEKIGQINDLSQDVIDKIDIKYEKNGYDSTNELVNALYDEKVSAIIISDIGEYLIENEDKDFTKKVRIIKTISIKKEEEVETSSKNITKEPFILYISGIDTGGSISKVSRSDVNIVATINPVSHEVLLTSIPRDYYVQLNGTTGTKDKLTHAGIYGVNKSITTIEDLLQIDIDYYAKVNFDTVVNLVDEIGGITIYSDQDLSFCNIKKGNNTVDGACALRFARERKSYASGDRHRGENQEEVIEAIINKVQTSPVILTKYNSILKNLEKNFETNVSNDVVKDFIKMQIKDMPSWEVESLNLDGYDSHNYTYSGGNSVLYVMEPNEKSVNKASETINAIISGKTFKDLGM